MNGNRKNGDGVRRLWRALPVMWALTALVGMRTQAAAQQGVAAQRDVVYGIVEGESLKLDLYRPSVAPAAGELRPGIVFIHGGGWSGGDKGEFDGKAQEMAQRGYVAVTVNYRLAPKYRFPAAVVDCQRAVRWLREHAGEFHLDANRIGAMGASAGGHLASFLGVHDTWESNLPGNPPPSRVNCVVDYFGRMDLNLPQGGHDYRPDFTGVPSPPTPSPKFGRGGVGGEGLAAYRAASPITYVDSHTPPFLIVQGAQDPQVWPDQSQHMFEALQKAGIESSLLLLAGQGHGFSGNADRFAWNAAKAFLDMHLMNR